MSFNPKFEAKNDLSVLEEKRKKLEAQGKQLNAEDQKKYDELKKLFSNETTEPKKEGGKGPYPHV